MTQESPFDFVEAISAVRQAKRGDLSPLAEMVRSGAPLGIAEREFISDFLTGRVKVKVRPFIAESTFLKRELIYRYVHVAWEISGGTKEAAVAEAQAEYKVSRRTVFYALKAVKEIPERQSAFHDNLNYFARRIREEDEKRLVQARK